VQKKHEVLIREQESDLEHIHILFCSNSKANLVHFIQYIKGSRTYFLFREFPEIKLYLWGGHLWTPSYFLATTGQMNLDIVKIYIENQGKK
jgi:putative transposase